MRNMIRITAAALPHLKRIGRPNVLFHVKSGGCNGLEYVLEATDIPSDADEQRLDGEASLWVCHQSVLHLLHTEIDWVEDTMGSRFVFSNPNAQASCGCGQTFTSGINSHNG